MILSGCIPDYPVRYVPVAASSVPCAEPCSVTDLAEDSWFGEGSQSWAGDALDPLGAVGDAADGLVVGAKSDQDGAGAAYVVVDPAAPPPGRSLAEATAKLVWDDAGVEGGGARLGSAVQALVGADGAHQAVAIAAELADDGVGAVWIVTGGAEQGGLVSLSDALAGEVPGVAAAVWRGSAELEATPAGAELDGGDFDGDGRVDLAIGSHRGAWVLRDAAGQEGMRSLADAPITVGTSGANGQVGCSVALIDAFDGTGDGHLAVGACLAEGGLVSSGSSVGGPQVDRGAVAVIPYAAVPEGEAAAVDLEQTYEILLYGEPLDRLGVALEDAGDLNDDGYHDLLIGGHECGADGLLCSPTGYGSSVWYVIGGGADPGVLVDSAPFAVAPVLLALHLAGTHKSCDTGVVGAIAGGPEPDLAVAWCETDAGGVLLVVDPCADGLCGAGSLAFPGDEGAPRTLFLPGGGGPGALVGAELAVVGERLAVGGWKEDSPFGDLAQAGVAHLLTLGPIAR